MQQGPLFPCGPQWSSTSVLHQNAIQCKKRGTDCSFKESATQKRQRRPRPRPRRQRTRNHDDGTPCPPLRLQRLRRPRKLKTKTQFDRLAYHRAHLTQGLRPIGRVRKPWRTIHEGTTVAEEVVAVVEDGLAKMAGGTEAKTADGSAARTATALLEHEDGVSSDSGATQTQRWISLQMTNGLLTIQGRSPTTAQAWCTGCAIDNPSTAMHTAASPNGPA